MFDETWEEANDMTDPIVIHKTKKVFKHPKTKEMEFQAYLHFISNGHSYKRAKLLAEDVVIYFNQSRRDQ